MDLVTFLKTYSKVDNNFIDDFYGMYNPKNKYNFCINLDAVAKWLEARKGNIKATLVASYIKNKDYIIKHNVINLRLLLKC